MIQVEERKSTAYDPYKALGLAIIEAAATVYKDALVKHDDVAIAENEKFFRSEWAQSLILIRSYLWRESAEWLRRQHDERKGISESGMGA